MIKYDDIFTFSNLYKAHLKSRRCKRHKKDVITFEIDLSNNLYKLYKDLKRRAYKTSDYNHFTIIDPKKREIQALHYKDMVVQHVIVDNYLIPLLERHLIYDNGACRVNKGTDFSRNRVRSFLTKYYRKYGNNGYILQFDIHHYFESIKHNCLLNKLSKIIKDKEIYKFLEDTINSYSDYDNSGLPIGNQTSQCFALYYLDSVDRLIKENYRIKYYSRYMDDGIIICNEKERLQRLLVEIKEECSKLGLEVNQNKTRIYKLKEGFTYLGFRFILLNSGKIVMKIPNSKKARIIRYLKSKSEKDRKESIVFYKDYLMKGNNYRFYKSISNLK